jgi:hypothetical protein
VAISSAKILACQGINLREGDFTRPEVCFHIKFALYVEVPNAPKSVSVGIIRAHLRDSNVHVVYK